MKKHARTLVIALAAVGFAASVAALYVHYRLAADPSYTSFCDVSETVNCEAVLTSQYGSLFGVPVAAGGAIWSALVLLLGVFGMAPVAEPAAPASGPAKAGPSDRPAKGASRVGQVASTPDDRVARVAGYIFLLSTLGLAAVLYLGYASVFILRQACPLCMAMYASVIGLFIVSGGAASELSAIPGALGRDVRAVTASPLGLTLAAGLVAAAVGLVGWFPREAPVAETATAEPVAPPTETLGPDETQAFEAWLAAQPRVPLDVPGGGARVVVVKFNDYQCPACRQAYIAYKAIQQKYEAQSPGQVAFVNVDYPLESECNTGGIHSAACEAAVAVRLARARDRAPQMEEWLFDNQPGMTRDSVKQALADIAQVTDFDAQYATVLEEVRKDAQLGQKLQITGTPTFFINGVRIASTLRPAYFDAAIAWELKQAAGSSPQATGQSQAPAGPN
jgi:uncharacterized membrane protein/protein-disulfide isomerase